MTADIQTIEVLVPGVQGPGGASGPSPAYAWFGTAISFQMPDGTMGAPVNLRGPSPAIQWTGTAIAFQLPDGSWSDPVDLQGEPGGKGDRGEKGGDGKQGPRGFRGDRGDTGPPPELVVGQVNHLAPDQSPTMTLDPVAPGLYALAFGVPQGRQGDQGNRGPTGPAPKMLAGTVTTVPFTSPAKAHVQAGANLGEYEILLEIPQGAPGDQEPVGSVTAGNVVVFNDANGRIMDGGKLAPLAFSAAWGDIGGKPAAFPPIAHTHALADITNAGALAGKNAVNDADWSGADLSIANGGTGASTAPTARTNLGLGNVENTADADKPISTATASALALKADLVDGKLPESQIPAVAITDVFEVASQAAMLALDVQRGDVAVRSDLNKSFILRATPATTLANWTELRTPTDAVLSVAGKTGAVALVVGDIGGLTSALAAKADTASLGALAAKNTVNNGDWSGTALTVGNGGTGATTAAGARTNLGALAKTGDRMTGSLSSAVKDHGTLGAVTEAYAYADGNTHRVTINGAHTINPTGLNEGDVMQVNVLYQSGSIAVSGTTQWELGGTAKSSNIADVGATLVAGAAYRIVFEVVAGVRTGVFQ